MSKVRVTLTLSQAVLDGVDEAAWRRRLSRSAFVESVLEGLAGRGVTVGVAGGQASKAVSEPPRPASTSGGGREPVSTDVKGDGQGGGAASAYPAGKPFRGPDWRGGKP